MVFLHLLQSSTLFLPLASFPDLFNIYNYLTCLLGLCSAPRYPLDFFSCASRHSSLTHTDAFLGHDSQNLLLKLTSTHLCFSFFFSLIFPKTKQRIYLYTFHTSDTRNLKLATLGKARVLSVRPNALRDCGVKTSLNSSSLWLLTLWSYRTKVCILLFLASLLCM